MLNDTSVASAGSYIRTCRRIRNSKKIATIRDFHQNICVNPTSMYVVFCKIDHCIYIHWCIVMGLGHNDPWIESHMWPQQTWGQRSSRGQWPLVQAFGKKGQCIHILWCIFRSNITMIAKVCDHESRRDSWFENRLVRFSFLSSGPPAAPCPPGCYATVPSLYL